MKTRLSDSENKEFGKILQRIDERVFALGRENVSAPERVVFSAMAAKLSIDNGGFRRFFELSMPLSEAASAFKELGLVELEAICRRLAALVFPEGEPPNYLDRLPLMEAGWSQEGEACQEEFWDFRPWAVEAAAYAYIKEREPSKPGPQN